MACLRNVHRGIIANFCWFGALVAGLAETGESGHLVADESPSRFYFSAGGGATWTSRDPVRTGPAELKLSSWSPTADGVFGYRIDDQWALELGYRGNWQEAASNWKAQEILVNGSERFEVNQWVKSRYDAKWNDFGLFGLWRFYEDQHAAVTLRGGIAGGNFSQSVDSKWHINNVETLHLPEDMDDFYAGPSVSLNVRRAIGRNWWMDLGSGVGAMVGCATVAGRGERLQYVVIEQGGRAVAGPRAPDVRVDDTRDYVAIRANANAGLGWDVCSWATLQAGYRVEFWSASPQIVNASNGQGAHIGTEAALFHGPMATVTIRFR